MSNGPNTDRTVIKLSERDVDDAKRLLALLAAAAERDGVKTTAASEPTQSGPHPRSNQKRAREILFLRRRRHAIFGRAMFGEPAWDLLLLLYVQNGSSRHTISRLAELASISKSTALRWLDYLETQRLICREPHPTDKRANFVALTDKGKEAMDLYLSETLQDSL